MEAHRELYISADAHRMTAAVEQMEHSLPDGWTRDHLAEAEAQSDVLQQQQGIFCFTCTKEGKRAPAMLVLVQKDAGLFYVSNIIPSDRHKLSRAEYNDVLEDFYRRVFEPYATKVGLEHRLTGAETGLEDWMSSETAEKLRRFSHSANKSTGSSHQNDRARWNEFILAAHREQSKLDPPTLRRWLAESEGWPPEVAEQLAIEYESGRELLAFAEGGRRSA
jgi:hypothetical protein